MKTIDISGSNGVAARVSAAASAPVRSSEPARALRLDDVPTDGPALTLANAGATASVDVDRVVEIRKAIEEDRYPVIPTRIADAMIAAGLLLRVK